MMPQLKEVQPSGGSHGIGFSIVTRLLQEGCAKVFVVDNNLVDSKEQRDEGIEEIEVSNSLILYAHFKLVNWDLSYLIF